MTQCSAPFDIHLVLNLPDSTAKNQCWKEILEKFSGNPYFERLLSQKRSPRGFRKGVQTGKTINLKMRNRLLRWLQEINNQAFHFSSSTLVNTIQILDEYLSNTDQHFSQLQLIGCAALYMSSKIHQGTIVAGECYVDCAGDIFSTVELADKQRCIFRTLKSDINFVNPLRILTFVSSKLEIDKGTMLKVQDFLIESFFNPQYSNFSEFEIALASLMSLDCQGQLKEEKVFELLQRVFLP